MAICFIFKFTAELWSAQISTALTPVLVREFVPDLCCATVPECVACFALHPTAIYTLPPFAASSWSLRVEFPIRFSPEANSFININSDSLLRREPNPTFQSDGRGILPFIPERGEWAQDEYGFMHRTSILHSGRPRCFLSSFPDRVLGECSVRHLRAALGILWMCKA
ncbi:hypothetical protein B0H12DRAFT_1077184 [Mycena haematopus]|nr:hypothetical protein B0H12DRAFT_1077184 [Mycena haematopus]